MKNMLPYNND